MLVYAKGAEHPLRRPCRELIAAIADARVEATTSVEAIQEFVHVRARRRERSEAAALGRDYAELLSPLLTIGHEQLQRGLALFEKVEPLGHSTPSSPPPRSILAPPPWSPRMPISPPSPAFPT